MHKEKDRKNHPSNLFLNSSNSNGHFMDSIRAPSQPDGLLVPQYQLPKQKQSNLLTYSQLENLFTNTLNELTNNIQCENHHKVLDETIQKISQCLQAMMREITETPERLLLNISICLSLWKATANINTGDLENLNKELADNWGIETKINRNFSILYLSLPYIRSQYKNMMQDKENRSKNITRKDSRKLQQRYWLFLIVCAKQFYQEKLYQQTSTLANQTLQDIAIYSKQSIRDPALKSQGDISGLKFKAYYLLYKVYNKLNRDQEEINSIEKCLEVLLCPNFILNKETSDGASKQGKTEVIEKLRFRLKTVKQRRQERGSKKKFHRRKLSSLSKEKSHSKLEVPKKQISTEKEQTGYYEKTHSISQKGYKLMDFKKTTKKHHNSKYMSSGTTNNFLMGSTMGNTAKMRNTGNMKPEEKYQIKVNKLGKKGYSTLNQKQYTFKTLMQELQQQKTRGKKAEQKQYIDYSNLLLLRPNQRKENFQFIKSPSDIAKRESKLTQIDPDMIADMKISNYDGSLYNLGSKFTIQGNSKFNNPCQDSARKHQIIKAVAESQKQFLSKFINNYDKIIKRKNKQIAEERKSSESSENYIDNQFCGQASSRMLLENICGTREPRNRKQKIFHTIQQVIIPQVILPYVGLVDQVRVGIKRVKDRQINHSHNNTSFPDNEIYAFHVKVFTEKYGVVYAERQLCELKTQDALSMQEKIMYMAQIDPANFIEKADLTTNICGYALEYLLLSFMKRYFSWKNNGLGIALSSQNKIIPLTQLAAPRNRMQAYHQVHIYQQDVKTFDEVGQKISYVGYNNIQSCYRKFSKIIRGSKASDSFDFSRCLPQSDSLLKFRLRTILINEDKEQEFPQNKKQNVQQCLLGEDLHLPALIHRICTETSCTFKEIEPEIHNDIISCFFMARQPEFMRNYFLRSMKFILITNETDIMKLYYDSWNFSFLFRLYNNREYSINWTHYKSKPLYSLSNFFFVKIEFEQKNHRTRKNKLLMTSQDLSIWNSEYSNLSARLTPFNTKQIFYEIAESLMKKIRLRRSMNAFKFGFAESEKRQESASSVSSDYFYTNFFKSINSNFSNHESFLSPELKNVHIIYQKMIKLKFCNSYGIVTIINMAKSKIYDFLVYIPSTQNYLGFSLPHHIFIDQKNKSSPVWADIIQQIEFEVRGSREKVYYIVKILNHQAFIQDNIFIQYFSINDNIYKMAVTIEEKKAPLNFQSRTQNLKNKIKRLLDIFDVESKQYRKPFAKIYSSQASKYMIYISITQTATAQSFIQSYYLKQLISLIYSKGKKDSNNPFVQKPLSSSEAGMNMFDEGLIQLSNLMLIFHILAKTYIQELSSKQETYFQKGDKNLTKSCQGEQKDIFTSTTVQSQLRNNIENKMMKETVQNSWNRSKINLNSPISKSNDRINSVIYLHKKLQFHKNNVPVSCIMHVVSQRKFFICLDNYKKGKIVDLEVDYKSNSMPFIHIIAGNPKVMIGARNRLAKQWKNLLLIS